jgi:hypothetical protein
VSAIGRAEFARLPLPRRYASELELPVAELERALAGAKAPKDSSAPSGKVGARSRGHSADTEAPAGPFEPQGDHSHAPSGPLAQNAHDDAAEQ